jgi:hypothetical protein
MGEPPRLDALGAQPVIGVEGNAARLKRPDRRPHRHPDLLTCNISINTARAEELPRACAG